MGDRHPMEYWAAQKGTEAWLVAALRIFKGWAIGQEVTEDAYDSAADETANIPIGYPDRYDLSR